MCCSLPGIVAYYNINIRKVPHCSATSLPLGQLEAFDPQVETFTSFVERVHLFFEANDIKEEKRRSVFFSIVGVAVYNLLRNLLAPVTPKDASL